MVESKWAELSEIIGANSISEINDRTETNVRHIFGACYINPGPELAARAEETLEIEHTIKIHRPLNRASGLTYF